MKYDYKNAERLIDMAVGGMTGAEIKAQNYAIKKAERENAPVVHLYDGKPDELANKWGAKRGRI